MRTFMLDIMTLDGGVFFGEAESLLVRTTEGDVQILAGHSDYAAALATGRAKVTVNGTARLASVSGGFLLVTGGRARLVATTFEFADEIDLVRAKKAKERAEANLRAAEDEEDVRVAKAKLARAITRIGVSEHK